MSKNFMGLIEQHIEKGILGAAALFLGAVMWLYVFNSPNVAEFEGKKLAPGELNQAISTSADQLKRAVDGAKPDTSPPEKYKDELVKAFKGGVFAAPVSVAAAPDAAATADPAAPKPAAPILVKESLRLATAGGGKPIEIPGEDDNREAAKAVALVAPLPPVEVMAGTGRGLVVRKSPKLGETPGKAPAALVAAKDDKADEPVELPWVTIAGYYRKKDQELANSNAKYAPERRKAYVAGVDVERREMLAGGEWSEWALIEDAGAMPKLEVPDVVLNSDGSVLNRKAIDEAWNTVKREQTRIMQSPFYEVRVGDPWQMPQAAAEQAEEGDDEKADKKPKPARAKPTPRPVRGPVMNPGMGRGGGGGRLGGGGGISADGGGSGGRLGGGHGGGAQGNEKEERDAAKTDLAEAQKRMRAKEYAEAMGAAQRVVNNAHASDANKKTAQGILDEAQKKMSAESGDSRGGRFGGHVATEGGVADAGGRFQPMMEGGGRGMAPMLQAGASPAAPLVEHPDPEKRYPAVWFNDDTVKPGKTYQYRMRVRTWNRYWGQTKLLANPEDAKKPVLEGEWSSPTDPVTVAPQTRFFVRSMKPESSAAQVEVWKWRRGKWVKQLFDVAVGDVIGGERMMEPDAGDTSEDVKGKDGKAKKVPVNFSTGAVVLDLRVSKEYPKRQAKPGNGFDWVPVRDTLILTYLDAADGQVKERVQALDQVDPIRKSLAAQEKDES